MTLNEKINKETDKCYWYMSLGITQGNPWYKLCRQECNGYRKNCYRYISPKTLKLAGKKEE